MRSGACCRARVRNVPHQPLAARRGLGQLGDRLGQRALAGVFPQQVRLHQDDGERIVQLVGHTGQHRTHGRELLPLHERLLLALRLRCRPLAFDSAAQLRPNLRHGLQQGRVGRQGLGGIALQDTGHLLPH